MAASYQDPQGFFLTEKDLSVIRPEYENWLRNGGQGTLQHYIDAEFFANVAEEKGNDDSFDWDKAEVIKSKFSRDPFDDIPVIGSKFGKDKEENDSYTKLETFGSKSKSAPFPKSKYKNVAEKRNDDVDDSFDWDKAEVIRSKFSRDLFNDIPAIESKFGKDKEDDSYEKLETFGSKSQYEIQSKFAQKQNQIQNSNRSVSFLDTAKKVKFGNSESDSNLRISKPMFPQRKAVKSSSSHVGFSKSQEKESIDHLKSYISQHFSIGDLVENKFDYDQFKIQIAQTIEQLSRPKNQKLDLHPVTHDMVDINKISDLRYGNISERDTSRFKQAGIVLSTMNHETFKERSRK